MSRRPARARCPMCGRPAAFDVRPFCSRRCADNDLARWLGGEYRIATEDQDLPDAELSGPSMRIAEED